MGPKRALVAPGREAVKSTHTGNQSPVSTPPANGLESKVVPKMPLAMAASTSAANAAGR